MDSRASPLSPMDLRLLQNGLLGRSQSTMELSQSSSQFPLSGNAQLVGTVAALQEESGQMRSQWKSDVARLESELGQLRNAAAWALPQLGMVQQQQPAIQEFCMEGNIQALALPCHGSRGPLQQALMLDRSSSQGSLTQMKALRMPLESIASTAAPFTSRTTGSHGTSRTESTMQRQISETASEALRMPSESIASTAAPFTRQTSHGTPRTTDSQDFTSRTESTMHRQTSIGTESDQTAAPFTMHRQTSIGTESDQTAAPFTSRPASEAFGRTPEGLLCRRPLVPDGMAMAAPPRDQSAMQLTEALLFQMRASNAGEDSFAGGSPGQSVVPARVPLQMRDTLAGTVPAAAPEEAPQPPGNSSEVAQIYQELEKIEMELRKVLEENRKLREDKESCESAHSRDVTTLEAMLGQMMEDNQRLAKALSDSEAALSSEKKLNTMAPISDLQEQIAQCKKFEAVPLTPNSIRSVSEPAIEPDIERSVEFGRFNMAS